VIALSPAGGALRVVVASRGLDEVRRTAERLGAEIHPLHPVFEDVFLARLRESAAMDREAP
jgi:hypothetical protein